MSTKRELVSKVFHNEKAERVPVGFWFHFLQGQEFDNGLNDPDVLKRNLAGHKKFAEDFDPDFVKIMTDGFFNLPIDYSGIKSIEDLKNLKPIDKDHPFFARNIELVKGVREIFGGDRLLFFNVFSPFNQLISGLSSPGSRNGIDKLAAFLEQDASAVAAALDVIAENLITLIGETVKPGLADGIYLSVNNPNRRIPAQIYSTFVSPSEKKILEAAQKLGEDNILHICGYAGNKNILSVYRDYPVNVINWAITAEQMSLKDGKEYFGGKAVIGGFNNVKEGLLYSGSREEIEKYVEELLQGIGTTGVVIGADCTVPSDIDIERLKWVRDKAAEVTKV